VLLLGRLTFGFVFRCRTPLSLVCVLGRHGKYVYAAGATSVLSESVRLIADDSDDVTAAPMIVDPVLVTH